MLQLLDSINPEWKLTEGLDFWVIPSDTIRRLYARNLISSVSFRPSRERKVKFYRSLLNKAEKKIAYELGTPSENFSIEKLQSVPLGRRENVLDTAYEYFRYHSKEGIQLKDFEKRHADSGSRCV